MQLYPRDANKPERAEAVGEALKRLIEENLEIERWRFRPTFTKFARVNNIKIIYDSDWCRVKFKFSRVHYPGTDEILIDYGRLHAPDEDLFMVWNGEGCRCWHNFLDPLRFLDGLTPQEAYQQAMIDKQLPPVVREFRESEQARQLAKAYPPKAVIVQQSALWEHYGERFFELFDLRHPDLWEGYRRFLKEYYKLLGMQSGYGLPYENVC